MSPDQRNRHEREIARLLEGRRLPNNGAGQPDDLATTPAGTLAVQVKTRAAVPARRSAAMDQAARDATATNPDAVPIVVIAHPSPGIGSWRYAVLELEHPAALPSPEAVAALESGAVQDMRTGKIDHCQAAFANDFGLLHARAREGNVRSRTDGTAKRPESDGAGPQVVENPCENARKAPRKPPDACRNAPDERDSP